MSDELTTLRAKVKAQGDYIRKLRGEYRAMSEQFESRLAGYRNRVRKLRAELSAATADAASSDTFMCGYLLGADQREIGGTDEQHTASMEELGWVRIGRLAQAEGEPSAAEADERDVVPAIKYQIALDAACLAARDAERWKRIARDHQGLCKSLRATNEDLLQIIADLNADNAKLRELVKNMHGWLVVNYEKFYVIPLNGLNNIERDMMELGIKVDG